MPGSMSESTDTTASPADTAADAAAAPRGPLAREALALAAFDHLVAHSSGFRARPGQRDMAAHIAETLSLVDWPVTEDSTPAPAATAPPGERAIAVVQAGTGVGKSAAYAATVIPLALAHQKRVILSTATVALQEQLMAKDLPALSAALPQPFTFALAKGRGRYVCRLKLDQLSGGDAASADLFESDDAPDSASQSPDALAAHTVASAAASARAAERWDERARQYTQWSLRLDAGDWDGDRDQLADPPEAELWGPVAAERHTCTARHCPSYQSCSYYRARARLAQAQVIVVNHDLLLATLGLHALPAPSDCYLVLDEAHHLGAVAQGQFTESMDLMRSQWLDRLPRAVEEVAGALHHAPGIDVAEFARELKRAQGDLARLAMARIGALPSWDQLTGRAARAPAARGFDEAGAPVVERFEGGALPPEWMDTVAQLATRSAALLKVMEALATQLKANARDNPGDAARCAKLYSRLGVLAPRLQHLQATAGLWLPKGSESRAPWVGPDQPASAAPWGDG